jgi:mannose-6-phosphate isomerase-like protein (cupin superfamily)
MKKLISGAAAFAGLAALIVAATALATDGSGISTSQLSLGRFGKINLITHEGLPQHQVRLRTKGDSDVYVVSNTVVPGGHSGWHTHPGPSLITVKQGTATFYDADDPKCKGRVYPAGTGVIDPGDGHVHLLRNEGSVDLVTITVQILPAGASRRIDAPSPGNCGF